MHYDESFRKNNKIISENFVSYGEPIENEYHAIVFEGSILEVTI